MTTVTHVMKCICREATFIDRLKAPSLSPAKESAPVEYTNCSLAYMSHPQESAGSTVNQSEQYVCVRTCVRKFSLAATHCSPTSLRGYLLIDCGSYLNMLCCVATIQLTTQHWLH